MTINHYFYNDDIIRSFKWKMKNQGYSLDFFALYFFLLSISAIICI